MTIFTPSRALPIHIFLHFFRFSHLCFNNSMAPYRVRENGFNNKKVKLSFRDFIQVGHSMNLKFDCYTTEHLSTYFQEPKRI